MSDTEGMVRLMEHAAESARNARNGLEALTLHGSDYRAVIKAISALSYARAVLQMVAASVSPEARSLVNDLVSCLIEGDDEVGYGAWADKHNGVTMTDGELADVGRYLRSLRVGERS